MEQRVSGISGKEENLSKQARRTQIFRKFPPSTWFPFHLIFLLEFTAGWFSFATISEPIGSSRTIFPVSEFLAALQRPRYSSVVLQSTTKVLGIPGILGTIPSGITRIGNTLPHPRLHDSVVNEQRQLHRDKQH